MFPKDFLWGVAMSANQTEGGYQDRGITTSDVLPIDENRNVIAQGLQMYCFDENYYPTRQAIEFYHHYKEDIALLHTLGVNVFRFSILWTRILPNGDISSINEKGLQFYEDVVDECKKYNIEPMITLNHYDVPINLVEKYGGWRSRKLIDDYLEMCELIVARLKGKVKYWIPFNESDGILRYPFLIGGLQFQYNENKEQVMYQAIHHQLLANALCSQMIKKMDPKSEVGCMVGMSNITSDSADVNLQMQAMQYARNSYCFLDTLVRGYYPRYYWNMLEASDIHLVIEKDDLNILKMNHPDYICVPYYYRNVLQKDGHIQQEINSGGLRLFLNQLFDRYQLPIVIAENAIGNTENLVNKTINDKYRVEYMQQHIEQIAQAIQDGVCVKGYTPWSWLDGISVGKGKMSNRYGLVYVDLDDMGNGTYQRYPKQSFYAYQQMIERAGKENA